MAGSSVTTRIVTSRNRNFTVELISKGKAIGNAEGRSQQVDTNIESAGQQRTTTSEMAGLRTSSGSGEAVMRKLSSETGKVVISFTGPRETGRSSTGGWTTFSNSKCGYNQSLPAAGGPTPQSRGQA